MTKLIDDPGRFSGVMALTGNRVSDGVNKPSDYINHNKMKKMVLKHIREKGDSYWMDRYQLTATKLDDFRHGYLVDMSNSKVRLVLEMIKQSGIELAVHALFQKKI